MLDKLKQKEAHPGFLIAFVILVILGMGYVFYLKPEMEAARAKKDWFTPEAIAKRNPDSRKNKDPGEQTIIDKIKADERAKLQAKQNGSGN